MTHYSTLFSESANATLQIPNTVHVLTRRHQYNPIFAPAGAYAGGHAGARAYYVYNPHPS